MKPYYQDKWVTIYHGDCREILPQLNVEVDLVLTDPPWFVSSEVIIHRSFNPQKYKYTGKDIVLDFGDWDHFENEAEYRAFTRDWLEKAASCLREKGHLVTFFDQNRTSWLIEDAKDFGLRIRQHLYWVKSNPVPRARKVDFMVALEHACWFTKGNKAGATFNYQLGQQPNYILAPIPGHTSRDDGERSHPTQKPFKVFATWISYLSNPHDLILDPFLGSGVTCYCAKKLNRYSIGMEIEEKYCEIAARRCCQQVMDTA
jgi:DNA modification methylase